MLNAVQADIYLHHLAIESKHPENLANFYSEVMDMKLKKISFNEIICEGPFRKMIITNGTNKTLSYAGMVCRSDANLDKFKEFLFYQKVEIKEFPSTLYKKGSFSVMDPDQNMICFGILNNEEKLHSKGIQGPLQHLTFKESSLKKFEQNLMNNFQYFLNRYITKLLSRVNEVIKSFPN